MCGTEGDVYLRLNLESIKEIIQLIGLIHRPHRASGLIASDGLIPPPRIPGCSQDLT